MPAASGSSASPAANVPLPENKKAHSLPPLAALAAGDAELRHPPEPRDGGGAPSALGSNPSIGGALCRPYLSTAARKRVHEQNEQHERLVDAEKPADADEQPLVMRLPCGARGAAPALKLRKGDPLHVPFSASEASLLVATLSRHGHGTPPSTTAAAAAAVEGGDDDAGEEELDEAGKLLKNWAKGEEAEADGGTAKLPPMAAFDEACALLPGRTASDCVRFWQSGECAAFALELSTAVTPATTRRAATEATSSGADAVASGDGRMWRLQASHVSGTTARGCCVAPACRTARCRSRPSRAHGGRVKCLGVSWEGASAAASSAAAAATSARVYGPLSTAAIVRRPSRPSQPAMSPTSHSRPRCARRASPSVRPSDLMRPYSTISSRVSASFLVQRRAT